MHRHVDEQQKSRLKKKIKKSRLQKNKKSRLQKKSTGTLLKGLKS